MIIGAGPTGLGAANRLSELGEESFLVLERNSHVGGLASSFKDERGFTWDMGGHVLFSHYRYFDRLVEGLLGSDYQEHQRESWIRVADTWTPYPFQNNIRYLPPKVRWECVRGLLPGRRPEAVPENFSQWIETVFGRGIAEVFLWPYNFKVWATPPELMGYSWTGERISEVSLESVLKNILLERDDVSWGPNNTFRFPLFGGTGEIFKRLADRVSDRIMLGQPVVRVDWRNKLARTADGLEVRYEKLLSTAPLDLLVSKWLVDPGEELVKGAAKLKHSGVHVSGVGLDKRPGNSRCWMYFPEGNAPFYRVTNFHNYSPNNVARPGSQTALMCETSFSPHKPEDISSVMDRTVQGLVNTTLIRPEDVEALATRWEKVAEYGYPTPCLERDPALKTVQPALEQKDIYSRGRFGGWKYEVGNMDHSVMQGVEWVERMIQGKTEKTYTCK